MKTAGILRSAVVGLAASVLFGTAALAESPTYTVGSTPSGIPFTFLNVETNQIDGVMVDIVEAIGELEGFTPQVEATQWSALIPSLTSNKIDIIAAAMYATPERAQVVAFSEPVYSYGEGLFVKGDDSGSYKTLDDLEGKVIGAQVGTAYVDAIKANPNIKEVKVYDSIADIMRDVALGRIDAGVGDWPVVAYQLNQGASKARLVEEYESQITGDVALAVRQSDTELLDTLNAGLGKLKESGKLDEIVEKWGIN